MFVNGKNVCARVQIQTEDALKRRVFDLPAPPETATAVALALQLRTEIKHHLATNDPGVCEGRQAGEAASGCVG